MAKKGVVGGGRGRESCVYFIAVPVGLVVVITVFIYLNRKEIK